MANFTPYRRAVHVIVSNLMGERVTWTPTGGGDPVVVKCTAEFPTEEAGYGIGQSNAASEIPWMFDPQASRFEFQTGDFPGLADSVRGGTDEFVTIDVVDPAGNVTEALGTFAVKAVERMYDGHYFKALIEKQ